MIIDDNVTGNGANDSVADPSPFFFLRSSVLAFFFYDWPSLWLDVSGRVSIIRKKSAGSVAVLAGPTNNKSRSDFTTWLHYCCLIYFDLFLD